MLEKEIGSNFCEAISESKDTIEDDRGLYLLDSGRSAINLILEKIKGQNIKVLLPIYTCESVIKPFITHGCDIKYYKVNKKLEIIAEEFGLLLESFKPQLVYIHSYFGFDTLVGMKDKINQLQDTVVIEDITHSMLSNITHLNADFYVGSIRKWCALPDGGILKIRSENAQNSIGKVMDLPENKQFVTKRLTAQRMKAEYFLGDDEKREKDFIAWFDESENILDSQTEFFSMSNHSRNRIKSVDWQEIKNRRYDNYRYLTKRLSEISEVELVVPDIDGDTVPLYCPIYVKKNRNELRVCAREQNVMLPVIWPTPPMLSDKLDDNTEWIYDHILAIPCDQRYTQEDMEKIIEVIKLFYSK